jgi:hypothetical protein
MYYVRLRYKMLTKKKTKKNKKKKDVAGQGGLFCVGRSIVAGRLELSG